MCKLRHPNVVAFYGVTKPPSPMIVSQLMHGSLFDIVHKSSDEIDTEIKLRILRDIACGAHYLHSRRPPIVHRDLSSVNVLVTGDIHWLRALTQAKKLEPLAKLNDFGLSRQVEWYMTAGCGNFYYIGMICSSPIVLFVIKCIADSNIHLDLLLMFGGGGNIAQLLKCFGASGTTRKRMCIRLRC